MYLLSITVHVLLQEPGRIRHQKVWAHKVYLLQLPLITSTNMGQHQPGEITTSLGSCSSPFCGLAHWHTHARPHYTLY